MGSDNLPAILLRVTATQICESLSFIYNLWYHTACVPFLWKRADVIPLPKSSAIVKNEIRPTSVYRYFHLVVKLTNALF